jgi:phosphoglycolate phosphatase-like HAD superfamily hydrolase
VDDARSARAAGVRFIGIAQRNSVGLRALLEREGAAAVIENINAIERSFDARGEHRP